MQSVQELQENLITYRGQLEQVNQLLEQEPENEEYKEMAQGLVEVIELTQDLLTSAQQGLSEHEGSEAGPGPSSAALLQAQSESKGGGGEGGTDLDADVSLAAQRLLVGSTVQAVWSGDDQWREGVVDSLTKSGYMVRFGSSVGGGSELHEVREMRVRRTGEEEEEVRARAREALAQVEREAEEQRQALKRKMAEAAKREIAPVVLPSKLKIKPDDPEDVRAEKKRKIHAIKSKQRLQNLEIIQDKKQNAWHQFQAKGTKKKAGFFTGKKKESMFKSPEDPNGRVGVVGSGKAMTDFQRRGKHSNLKLGGEEEED